MLQNAYLLAEISADTAENERNFAEILPKICNYPAKICQNLPSPPATSRICVSERLSIPIFADAMSFSAPVPWRYPSAPWHCWEPPVSPQNIKVGNVPFLFFARTRLKGTSESDQDLKSVISSK